MIKPETMSYGETIRLLRKRAGMSQGDVARQVGNGITNQSVSGWERGKSRPTIENLVELARIFRVSVADIMAGETPPKPTPAPPVEDLSIKSDGLLFAGVEEALIQVGVTRAAASEIAGVVKLAVENLKETEGMTPTDAIRRVMRWEVPDILKKKQ